jgi:hypothetical protein
METDGASSESSKKNKKKMSITIPKRNIQKLSHIEGRL